MLKEELMEHAPSNSTAKLLTSNTIRSKYVIMKFIGASHTHIFASNV